MQQAAAATFHSLPMPTRRDEAWRFSDLKRIDLSPYVNSGFPGGSCDWQARSLGLDSVAARFIYANDELVSREVIDLPPGVVLQPLGQAAVEHEAVVREHFMREQVRLGSAKFAALHLARLATGTFLHIPKNVRIDAPIEIFHWVEGENVAVFPHTLIVCGENSQATVVEHFLSADGQPALACAVNDLHVGRGASLTYVTRQEWSRDTLCFHLNATRVARDASALALQANLGGAYVRTENLSRLLGEGGRSDMLAVSPGSGDQFFDQRTFQEHAAPHTTSDLLFVNALDDRSRSVFSGLIRADEGAHFIDAYQKARNLLLSPQAEADSLPGLEIQADRVKCTHGATTGAIDPEQIFYLLARGIAPREARRLITLGFLGDALKRLPSDAIRMFLDEAIARRLA